MIPFFATVAPLATFAPLLAAQDTAARHPADARLYLEVANVPELIEAYGGTAFGRALADGDLHQALGAVLGMEPLDPRAWLRDQYAGAVESGDMPPLKEILLDPLRGMSLSITLEGGLAATIEAAEAAGSEDASLAVLIERMGVQFDVELADEAAAQRLAEFMTEGLRSSAPGFAEMRAEVGGVEVVQLGSTELPAPVRYVLDGGHLTFAFGALDNAQLIANTTGETSGFSTGELAERGLPDQAGTPVLELYNGLAEELWTIPDAQPAAVVVDLLEATFGTTASMILRGGHWRVALDEGRFVTQGLHAAPSSPFQRILGSQPLDRTALTLVHPDAIVATVSHLDKEALLEALASLSAELGEDPIAALEEQFGFRVDDDLIAPLGSAIAYSLPSPKSLLSAPPFTFAAALLDRAAFEPGIEGLLGVIEAESDGVVTVEASDYRDMRLYTLKLAFDTGALDLPIPIDPAAFFRPTFVVMDDRFFVTTLPQHAKKEIRRLLRSEVDPHPVLGASDLPQGVSQVGFADWIQFLGQLYTGVRAFAGMAGALGEGEMPFDLASLPDAEVITRHFGPTLRWRRAVEGGVLQHEESSFGPEVLPALLFGGVAAVGLRTIGAPVVAPPVAVDDAEPIAAPVELPNDPAAWDAYSELLRLKISCEMYKLDRGEYPERLESLAETSASYPDGYVTGDPVGEDPWGAGYRYAVRDGVLRLWSVGPDGVDDSGEGDDVLVTD